MAIAERLRWRVHYAVIALSCGLLLSGCAQWSNDHTPETQSKLPALKLSPDSVTVETVLVRFPLESETELRDLWTTVDESVFEIELRKRLDKNGIRAGVILGELPEAIRQQLSRTSQEQTTDALEYAGLAADVDNKMRKLQCRAGRRKDLLVRREVAEPITVISTLDGRLFGETFQSPTVLFDLRVIPHANGQATIELTPEVQHGEPRQSYVSTEFGVRPDMRREQTSWQELSIHARLSQGQVLMVAGTLPSKAIGQALFTTKTAEQSNEHVVLLVRLAVTQLDELFMPEILEQAHALTER